MHLDHALTGTAILLRDHGSDEAVLGDLPIERFRKHVLVGAFHPVFAVEFLGDGVTIAEDLPLLVREIKVHGSAPAGGRVLLFKQKPCRISI